MRGHTRIGLLASGFSLLLLCGCVSTTWHPGEDRASFVPPSVSPAEVAVLRSLPDAPHQSLGTIEVWLSGRHSTAAILGKVREKAAAVGADAVVLMPGTTLFSEPMSLENEVVSPQAVSYSFTAIRRLESPPSSS